MDGDPIISWLVAYKIAALAAGCFFCFIGYRLFLRGIMSGDSDVRFGYGKWHVSFLRAAPGLIFMFVGGAIVVASIVRGLVVHDRRPVPSEATQPLPPALNTEPASDSSGPQNQQDQLPSRLNTEP